MLTTLINISRAPPEWREHSDYTYIGRGTKWGNPFELGRDGSRREVIAKHKQALMHGELQHLLDDLYELEGRILVCHCKPAACHGDTYIELLA